MMRRRVRTTVPEVLALGLVGGYFLYAGVVKFSDVGLFATQIDSYRLVPTRIAFYLAAGLPVYEIISALLLIPVRTRRVGLMSILLMLGVFSVALLSAIARGLEISCGCTGDGPVSEWDLYLSLARNLAFLAIVVWFYRLRIKRLSP